MGSQILICGPQHHSPKGFHAPCGDGVGLIFRVITKHNYAWIFGGITLGHYNARDARFG
jgi:hypothetical protein